MLSKAGTVYKWQSFIMTGILGYLSNIILLQSDLYFSCNALSGVLVAVAKMRDVDRLFQLF